MASRPLAFIRVPAQLLGIIARTAARRLRHGPRHPGWSLPYEALSRFGRDRLESLDLSDPARARARFAEIEVLTRLPRGVSVEPVAVDGMAGEWLTDRSAAATGVVLYLHGGGYVVGSCGSIR